ncbi:MAG: pyridoxamine 5'-phosphate oxidase family protein [Candidatus Peribacteria bacterium]|jgi:general stress protein 26|nr:pyridoxamine 5'-phosphate oxidase family protein [Candidatus Peribacteria bacterium]
MTPETLAKFVDNATTCLVGSIDENGFPQIRAMLAVRHRNGIQEFYLTTNTSSHKVKQFKSNEKASIYFYDPMNFV